VSEGPSELGDGVSPGALENLLHGLIGDFTCKKKKVSDSRELLRLRGKGRGCFKRAVMWMRYARDNGFDGIVLVIDQDDDPKRSSDLSEAQDYALSNCRRAFGVAIRTFDAWILADDSALSTVLGTTIPRQPDPEQIKDPKSECTRLRDASGKNIDLRDLYAEVASKADLDTISERCPKGFRPFADRVRRLTAVR
jgi:hypothetical protein